MTGYEPAPPPLAAGAARGPRPAAHVQVAMTGAAGALAVTVRRDRRPPNVGAIHGPGARRIGEARPAGGSTACWLAISRDGGIRGNAATFGAAVGLLVDAALEARTGA